MTCSRCRKPFEPFDEGRRCQPCRDYYSAYYAKNKETELARHAVWASSNKSKLAAYRAQRRRDNKDAYADSRRYRRDPEKRRVAANNSYHVAGGYFRHLRRKFGLTEEQFNEIAAHQGHRCAICSNPTKKFHVDHCHQTNTVRGLLCRSCNQGLGCFKDNAKSLMQAIAYLHKTSMKGITVKPF